jgi:hypothetical protein
VIEEFLLFLDPEQKDPVYNWARSMNQRVVGLSRPELTVLLQHGFYDVTIGFPSLGVSKDVHRIPLGPTLALRFSRDILGDVLPSEDLLRLASLNGIDEKGQWVYQR